MYIYSLERYAVADKIGMDKIQNIHRQLYFYEKISLLYLHIQN